jgi:N-acetylglucosamine-6-phosphate deacetylase
MKVLGENDWQKDHAVVIEAGRIKAILPKKMAKHHLPAKQYEFPEDYYLVPGLIDLHVHGTHGHDVMDGAEALQSIAQALAREGVTGFLATTMSVENEKLETALAAIAEVAHGKKTDAAILGVHLEGPFIAAAKKGAQRGDALQLPNEVLFQHLQKQALGLIKIVTLAPELPSALAFIKHLHAAGVIAAIGHTNATFAEAHAAITAGCRYATHLFNAMHGIHQREPGAAGALLLAPDVFAELIVDGEHLHPAMVELALRIKGREKLLLVTDAMRAKCLGDGHYELGGQTVAVKAQKATLQDGTLAGSTLSMPKAIQNMVHFTQCSLAEAISMAAHNPARILNLGEHKGSIQVGKDADLVVLDPTLKVMMTVRDGREVFLTKKSVHGAVYGVPHG